MNTFSVEIVTPDGSWPLTGVVSIDVPAENGRLTVLAHHQPFVCSLKGGTVQVRSEEPSPDRWEIERGAMRVARDGVTLVVQRARPAQIPPAVTGPKSQSSRSERR